MLRSLLPLGILLGACAVDPPSAQPQGGGGKADGSEPTVTFNADYSQAASGTLYAGAYARVRYDLDRITNCRGESGGSDVWGASGNAMFDDGSIKTFAVSRLIDGKATAVDAEIVLPPSTSHVEFWFEANDKWGCHTYDSDYGNNYSFAVEDR